MRLDPETKLCREHGELGCSSCRVADFREALAAIFLRAVQKRPVMAASVEEKFDRSDS